MKIFCSMSSWIQPKPMCTRKICKRSLTIRSWIRNNVGIVFFWAFYTFICLCICINVFRVYIGGQRAHYLVVIARINGKNQIVIDWERNLNVL